MSIVGICCFVVFIISLFMCELCKCYRLYHLFKPNLARAKLVLTLNCHLWIRVVVSQPQIVFYFFLPHLTGLDCVTNWPLRKFDMTHTQSGLNETLCYVQSKVTKQSVWGKKKKKRQKAFSFYFLIFILALVINLI